MAKSGKGKKAKKSQQQVSQNAENDHSPVEDNSVVDDAFTRKSNTYWMELRKQAIFLDMNQQFNKSFGFSYYIAYNRDVYNTPIGPKPEQSSGKKGKGKKKKK